MADKHQEIDSRKRPYGTLHENGNAGEPNRPAQEPRLMNVGHPWMDQFLQNITGQHSQAPGQALLSQTIAQQGGYAQMPAPAAPLMAPAQAPQPASIPVNHMMHQQQNLQATSAAAQQQADVANLVRQALAHAAGAQKSLTPQVPVPAPLASPNAAQVQPPIQANQAHAGVPVNHMVYANPNQISAPAPYATQPQLTIPQQHPLPLLGSIPPGQFRGMEPQELLNYAIMVNILHNSNPNALSNTSSSRPPHVPNQEYANQMIQPAQGMQGYNSGLNQAAAPPPHGFDSNQPSESVRDTRCSSSSYEHTVSPSLPSESNFNTSGSITGPITLPNHVIEAQKIDPQVRCVALWTNQDQGRLSTQQCWLRKQIEAFPASERDVRRHTRGRNRVLKLGQVGIQCIHCKNLPQEGRGKGSSYFLSSTKGIYQAAQNILAYHFKEDTCPIISQKLLQEMKDAGSSSCPRHLAPKAGKSRSGGGKQFWEDAAVKITGLIDTTVGIRYSDDRRNYLPLESVTLGSNENMFNGISHCSSESILVSREDKKTVTDFCFVLMSQFVPYAGDARKPAAEYSDRESDLEDEEEARRVGVVCRFCKGVSFEGKHRDGVFLSIKPSTMMRNKQLSKLHNHLIACRCVPEELRTTLVATKEMHLPQSDQLKRGWKKVFFENVSKRLKKALDAAEDSIGGVLIEKAEVKAPAVHVDV